MDLQWYQSDHGSLVIKIMDSCPACQEFEPSITEDSPGRESRCTLNMSRLKRHPFGGVCELGEWLASSGAVLVT
ncbi:hypothetical protein TNCV_557311 [Trichonephila clavipes]|uniref:Uncharacterized protein n=1 Tax=Trichonephila clavipes TaxID=2585209 RepID=A0A8X6RKW0_TRICX|nr:hypothetical protein TNCV_557311 [Trichonephila clavipes]